MSSTDLSTTQKKNEIKLLDSELDDLRAQVRQEKELG